MPGYEQKVIILLSWRMHCRMVLSVLPRLQQRA